MPWDRAEIARRAAAEVMPGWVVNLGIGLPTLVAQFLNPADGIMVHSENGLLGIGPYPSPEEVDADLINAGKETVTLVAGAASFDSSLSFAMIRGGHVDAAVLGAMEVSVVGDLANWSVPGAVLKGMGGAMDLVVGARKVIVTAQHRTRDGTSKLVERCTIPLTGSGVVDLVITDLGVLEPAGDRFIVRGYAPGVDFSEIAHATDAEVMDGTGVPLASTEI